MTERELTEKIIGCAIEVHRVLGPGLLESTYQRCLAHELDLQKVSFRSEVVLPVDYKGKILDCGYRLDLLVDGRLIVELKAVDEVTGLHQAQLMTYMKLPCFFVLIKAGEHAASNEDVVRIFNAWRRVSVLCGVVIVFILVSVAVRHYPCLPSRGVALRVLGAFGGGKTVAGAGVNQARTAFS